MALDAALARFAAEQGQVVWVVGGGLRDRLLGRPPRDLDVVTAGAVGFAKRFARSLEAHFVVLDDGRGTARVIDRSDTSAFIDFCEPQGADLAEDLRQRDFTVNALACTLESWLGEPQVLDATGGLADLRDGLLRVCSERSLLADPLRTLRGHRLAVALDFHLAPATVDLLRAAAPLLAGVASERVRAEWFLLLEAPRLADALPALAASGVLAALLPGLPTGGGERLERMDAELARLADEPELAAWVAEPTQRQMARFVALLSPAYAAAHPRALVQRFALTRTERRLLSDVLVPRDLRGERLLTELASRGLEVLGAVLTSALTHDVSALRARVASLAPGLARPALIDGHDLADVLCLAPGALYKVILAKVRCAQLAGTLGTRDEALALAREVMAAHE